MQKQFIAIVILCCLLLSGCGYAFTDMPMHSQSSPVAEAKTLEPTAQSTEITTMKPSPIPTPELTTPTQPKPAPTAVKIACTECNGTGICARCGGDGIGFYDMPCNFCQGGKCLNCGGKGYLIIEPKKTPAPGACAVCGGTGICNVCGGLGYYHAVSAYGDEKIECISCHGTGNCAYCDSPGIH